MAGGLLDGMRVLDLSLWQPGQTASQLLADLGADVIKVEPHGGDRMRRLPGRFAAYNGHKRSIVLDLKDDGDRARLFELVADAEVVIEGYRPGVADRLGVGFEALAAVNPAIVMCSITGYGQSGPLADVAGHDHNYQAYAGAFTFAEGAAPQPAGLLVGDQGSGMAAAFAIVSAVLCARRTGEGDHLDVAITDLLASWVVPMGMQPGDGASPASDELPAMGAFATQDGRWVELGVYSEDHLWDALCRALGLADLVGLDMAARGERSVELRATIAANVANRTRGEFVAEMTRLTIPVAPILSRDEMLRHPNFAQRGLLSDGPDGHPVLHHPVRYLRHPAREPGEVPMLDAHAGQGFGPPSSV